MRLARPPVLDGPVANINNNNNQDQVANFLLANLAVLVREAMAAAMRAAFRA